MARAKDEIRESIINQLPAEWNLTDSDAALWKALSMQLLQLFTSLS